MRLVLIFLVGLLGLAVGSFVNVVIYRAPRGESLVHPRSHCPHCGTQIQNRDNVPLVSWLVLRGRCRCCHQSISARYPLVELASAALFAGTAARIGFEWPLPAFLMFVASLLALSAIDLEHLLLPKKVVYPTLVLVASLLVIASAASGEWHRLLVAVECSLAWFTIFFLINFASPRYLGFGDVRLSLMLGLALGWLGVPYVFLGFFAANFFGAAIGIFLIATKRISRNQPIPYGVFLAMGAALAIYAGPELLAPFHRLG